MTITALFLGIVFFCVAAYIAAIPVLNDRKTNHTSAQNTSNDVHNAQDLRTRYQLLVDSIIDLDFDYDMNKVPYSVYAEQRKMLIGRSVSTLIQLDQIEVEMMSVDDEIEAAIHDFRHSISEAAD